MSMPFEQQQSAPPPPPLMENQQAYSSSAGNGSIGPLIGVLAVIAILGIIAGMIGRLCSGRSIMGYGGHFNFEGWIESKCSSCIDGRIDPPLTSNPNPNADADDSVPIAIPVENPQESKQREQNSPQNPPTTGES